MSNTKEGWTRKYIEFDRFALSYLEGGKIDEVNASPTVKRQGTVHRPTIVFLHGWSISTEPYRDCLNSLAEKYWIVALDLPGFGRSPYSGALLSYQTYANCIVMLLKKLRLDRFELIGHSFGGGVALALAAAIPSQVNSLIVIDSTGIPRSLTKLIQGRFAKLPQQIAQWRPLPSLKFLSAVLHNSIFQPSHLIEGAKIALNEDLRPWLSEIKSPSLVLWGERDEFIPLASGHELVEAIPNSRLQIVPGGYHEWNIMQPEKFAAIALDFFTKVAVDIK